MQKGPNSTAGQVGSPINHISVFSHTDLLAISQAEMLLTLVIKKKQKPTNVKTSSFYILTICLSFKLE